MLLWSFHLNQQATSKHLKKVYPIRVANFIQAEAEYHSAKTEGTSSRCDSAIYTTLIHNTPIRPGSIGNVMINISMVPTRKSLGLCAGALNALSGYNGSIQTKAVRLPWSGNHVRSGYISLFHRQEPKRGSKSMVKRGRHRRNNIPCSNSGRAQPTK